MNSARKIILVVDDDPGVLDYASNVLQECGYTVLAAPDGATALVLLRNHPQVDLLFTDVVMPGSTASRWRAGHVRKSPASKYCLPPVTPLMWFPQVVC
jgi:CheY-like chemotaxis protein